MEIAIVGVIALLAYMMLKPAATAVKPIAGGGSVTTGVASSLPLISSGLTSLEALFSGSTPIAAPASQTPTAYQFVGPVQNLPSIGAVNPLNGVGVDLASTPPPPAVSSGAAYNFIGPIAPVALPISGGVFSSGGTLLTDPTATTVPGYSTTGNGGDLTADDLAFLSGAED